MSDSVATFQTVRAVVERKQEKSNLVELCQSSFNKYN